MRLRASYSWGAPTHAPLVSVGGFLLLNLPHVNLVITQPEDVLRKLGGKLGFQSPSTTVPPPIARARGQRLK